MNPDYTGVRVLAVVLFGGFILASVAIVAYLEWRETRRRLFVACGRPDCPLCAEVIRGMVRGEL